MRVIRESWEGKEGVNVRVVNVRVVNVRVVNVKSFHYFDKILQIIRKIFGLAIDYLTNQIYLLMN